MISKAYYIIRPHQNLMEHIIRYTNDANLVYLLTKSVLWTQTEGGRTIYTSEDREQQIKLLFLFQYWREYTSVQESKPIINQIIGDPPFSICTFNSWWQIERYQDVDEDAHEIKQKVTNQGGQYFTSDDPQLRAWIDSIQTHPDHNDHPYSIPK